MRKNYWFGLVLLLTLVLSACAQQTAEPQPTPVPPTEEIETSPTQEEETSPTAVESGEMSGAADCGPYNLIDQILGSPNPNLAPVTEDDHALGAETAAMTIINFSDFQ